MHRLPENLNGRHATDILHGGGVDVLQRIVVFLQSHLRLFAEHHGKLRRKAHKDRHNGRQRQPGVQAEHHHDHHKHQHNGVDHVRKLMGDEYLDLLHILLGNLLDLADGIAVKPPQGQPPDVLRQPYSHAVKGSISRRVSQHTAHIHEGVADQQTNDPVSGPGEHEFRICL